MQEQETTKGIASFFERIARASDIFSSEWPNHLKPFGNVLFLIGSTIMFLVIAPFLIISTPFRKKYREKRDAAYTALNKRLKEIWHEDSSASAIGELNRVYSILHEAWIKDNPEDLLEIKPYGFFVLPDHSNIIANTLYLWEIQRDNWISGNSICDDILSMLGMEHMKSAKGREDWVIRKAKCLFRLQSKTAAEEYLLKYIDPKNNGSPINLYFSELRKTH